MQYMHGKKLYIYMYIPYITLGVSLLYYSIHLAVLVSGWRWLASHKTGTVVEIYAMHHHVRPTNKPARKEQEGGGEVR